MNSTKVMFSNDEGLSLSGILDTPSRPADHYALFAHCFTCGKNLKTAKNISRAMTEAGFAVLRFDFSGLGQSEGDFADTNFSSNVSDLIAAARFLESSYQAPAVLIGHSLGGTAVLRAAAEIESASAIATIGSPADPTHVAHLFKDSIETLEATGSAEVDIGGRNFRMKKQFLDDLEGHNLPEETARLRKALLVMHSPIDQIVEIDQASQVFMAAKHPKSFVSLDKADHLLTNDDDSLYAGSVLAAWASRYVTQPTSESATANQGVTATTWRDGFYTEVQSDDHFLIADEPKSVGGTDKGPSPYDLLSAALATCTTMTLRMYAEFKDLPMDAATVNVRHEKIHAKDCADCETQSGKIDEFVREITLSGDLTSAQRERMLQMADRCPVHLTLHGDVKVRTQLKDD